MALIVTFFGAGVAAHYVLGLDWQVSFLFSGLIIVTGPTVITPILRNIPLRKDVSAVLKWEGILIDPIGALVAVLVFGFISVNIPVQGLEEAASKPTDLEAATPNTLFWSLERSLLSVLLLV